MGRAIDRSPSTVTGIGRALVSRLYGRAEHILDRLEAPAYTFTATTINGIESKTLDHVAAPDEKALATAMSTHLGARGTA